MSAPFLVAPARRRSSQTRARNASYVDGAEPVLVERRGNVIERIVKLDEARRKPEKAAERREKFKA